MQKPRIEVVPEAETQDVPEVEAQNVPQAEVPRRSQRVRRSGISSDYKVYNTK